MKIYVVIVNQDGEIFTLGAYKTELEAIGEIYQDMSRLSAFHEKEGNKFEMSPLRENDNGIEYVRFKFKGATWKKPIERYYYIQITNFEVGKQ